MRAREGDFIETFEGLIFDVKGSVHSPDRLIAFVRYFPEEKGDRRRNGQAYGKVYSLSKRFKLLKERFPRYLIHDSVLDETICEVPVSDVKKLYDPVEKLRQLRNSKTKDSLEDKAVQLTESLKESANIPWSAIGISGSILIRLRTVGSDIDPIVYGATNCRKVHSALREMLNAQDSLFRPYRKDELKCLFHFRSKDTVMTFEEFVRTESRKTLQGKFDGTDYFVRCVKEWNEVEERYGDVQYKNIGYARIKATVREDSEAIFTPCTYPIENVTVFAKTKLADITEIVSFRGRFCEQAKKLETVVAQGKVESVTDSKRNCEHFRLLIGNKPSDNMVLI